MGIAGHAAQFGGTELTITANARSKGPIRFSKYAIIIENDTEANQTFKIQGQPLTSSGKEVLAMAEIPATNYEFLKEQAIKIVNQLPRAQMDENMIRVSIGEIGKSKEIR